jgi:hypothetical protein
MEDEDIIWGNIYNYEDLILERRAPYELLLISV